MAYLKINAGKIEITTGWADTPDFATDSAYEAARWLYDADITDWSNSSSMDFSDEDGWPTKNAGDEVIAQYERIIAAERKRRQRRTL
jgi:hypothetical protein